MAQGLRTWRQLRRSWYIVFFQLPGVPERTLRADGYRMLRRSIEQGAPPGTITPPEMERYLEAWRRPGALTAMLDYYRAAARALGGRLPPVTAPTLVSWGDRDHFLGAELAVPDARDVPALDRVEWLPGVSHWVMRDAPGQVNELLAGFFSRAETPDRAT